MAVKIEGYTIEEALSFPVEQILDLIFIDKPLVIKIGSAEVLGNMSSPMNQLCR